MKKVVILCLCCCMMFATRGQSFEAEMAKMQAAYQDVQDLYIELDNSVWEETKVVKQQAVAVSKSGPLYLYEMEDAAMLVNANYILMIDHLNKLIVYDKWTAEKAAALAKQHIPVAKDILKRYPTVVYQGIVDQYKQYLLENKNLQMSKVEVAFEEKTGFMRQVRYYYNPKLINKKVYTELNIRKIKINPSFKKSVFSEQNYITLVNKKFRGVGKYSTYTVRSAQ